MPQLRPSLPLLVRSAASTTRASARAALAAHTSGHPPFPVIPTCPDPSCPCSATPEGLDIDHKQNLNGSMSPYAQHLVIPTGRSDWTSKIEDEKDTAVWGKFTADMKTLLGRRGEFHDPFNNILITASSFEPSEQDATASANSGAPLGDRQRDPGRVDAMLFPGFQHVTHLTPDPEAASDGLKNLIRGFLLPEELHPIYKDVPDHERRAKTRDERAGARILRQNIENPTILICSHGQRDSRCGVLGPLLYAEFTRYINDIRPTTRDGLRMVVPETGTFVARPPRTSAIGDDEESNTVTVNIGMISHIGGHKWAGNVIVYIPPTFSPHPSGLSPGQSSASHKRGQAQHHELTGKGIWYGRVEPRHVQGIVEQTLLGGKVIADLFRGGVSSSGEILRL